MKKRFMLKTALTVCLILCAMVPHVIAAYEECVELSRVAEHDKTNTVFATKWFMTDGAILNTSGDVKLSPLPQLLNNNNCYVYKMCVYHDKIYYMAQFGTGIYDKGSPDDVPVSIYSCNLDGTDNRLLANNASNYNNVAIVDNVLYYGAYPSYKDEYYKGYDGGIYKINLNNLSWKKIVSDKYASMDYCDGDYIYYTVNGKTYAIDVNGNVCFATRSDTDEFNPNYKIRGNTTYYFSSDLKTLYSKDKNGGNIRTIATFPVAMVFSGISYDKIYISTWPTSGGGGGKYAYSYVSSVPRR